MSLRLKGAIWAHGVEIHGGDEVVTNGLISMAEGEHGRLQFSVKGQEGQSDYELGMYIEQELPNGELLIRVQRRS